MGLLYQPPLPGMPALPGNLGGSGLLPLTPGEQLPLLIRSIAEQRGRRASQALAQAAMQVLSGPRHGRIYRLRGGHQWQASAPGEAPAVRTGYLRTSWRPLPPVIAQTSATNLEITSGIRSDAPYLRFFDPKVQPYTSSRIAPRPYRDAIIRQADPALDAIYGQPWLADLAQGDPVFARTGG